MKKLIIYIDGAARGNPGPAGAGIVITDEKGRAVAAINKYLGEITNNVAEYTALILAMEEALSKNATDIIINTDSELLAKQLGGEYKVKDLTLKELYDKINILIESFQDVRITQIDRAKNKEADRLANEAIDNSVKKKKIGSSFILKSRN